MIGRLVFFGMLGWASGLWAGGSPLPERCAQALVVVSAGWDDPTGTLHRCERLDGGWRRIDSWPVRLGHRGTAVGEGLHGSGLAGPRKKEGDQRAPAGVFFLPFAFGQGEIKGSAFPYRLVDESSRWVDDPRSVHYNQWVQIGDPAIRQDWRSAERLKRSDGIYDYAIVVGHNRNPSIKKGRGSAIFMHGWFGPGRSTLGCTAMELPRVRLLIEWLDPARWPVLVQGPAEFLAGLELPPGLMP